MTLTEQIKVLRKYLNFIEGMKEKRISAGKTDKQEAEYEIECLKYALNSLIELRDFEVKIVTRNTKNV